MYKTIIIGRLAHDNHLLSGVCPSCNSMEDIDKVALCQKCGSPLNPIKDRKGYPMTLSEGTIYPVRSKQELNRLEEATQRRKNGMLPVYRFAVMSFTNRKTNELKPHPLHQYLAKGRQIMIEFNCEPVTSFFNSKDPKYPVQCEHKFVFIDDKDKIEFLDTKKTIEEGKTTETVPPSNQLNAPAQTQPQPKPTNYNFETMTVQELCAINTNDVPAAALPLLQKAIQTKLASMNNQNVSQPVVTEQKQLEFAAEQSTDEGGLDFRAILDGDDDLPF